VRATDLNHVSVCAHDLQASIRFYVDLFGLEQVPTPNFGFPVQWLRAGGRQLHLFERSGSPPTYQHFAFTVGEVERVYARAKELDCFDRTTFGAHLIELPGDCVQLYLRDPAGNLVEVNARGASQLPEQMRGDMVPLSDLHPQDEENLSARLFLDASGSAH
jgi:catechol 2,3-dioxygenase-like lactoylglutathione lyase family enzyme